MATGLSLRDRDVGAQRPSRLFFSRKDQKRVSFCQNLELQLNVEELHPQTC